MTTRTGQPSLRLTRPSPALVVLLAAALGLAAGDLYLLQHYPLGRYLPPAGSSGVSVGLREIFGSAWGAAGWYLVATLVAQSVCYALALVAVVHLPAGRGRWLLLGAPLLFAMLQVGLYPITAVDLFHYVASARTFWVHGDNPLTVAPLTYPFPVGMSYGDHPSPYGPLWTLLTAPVALVSTLDAADVRPALVAMKTLMALAYLASTVVVYAITHHLNPAQAARASVAYAWNPYVVFQAVGNGHNDVVFMLGVLLALLALVTERWRWVVPALAAAALIKYVSLLLLPPLVLYVLLLCRQRGTWRPWRDLLVGAGLAAVGALMIWWPFWAGWRSVSVTDELGAMFTSTPGALAYQLSLWTDVHDPAAWAQRLTAALFAVLYLGLLYYTRPEPLRLVATWYLLLLGLLVVAAPFVLPWYFLWVVTLGALLPGRGYLVLGVVIGLSANLVDPLWQFVEFVPWVQVSYGRMLAAPVALQCLPALLCLAVALLWSRSILLDRCAAPWRAPTRMAVAADGLDGRATG